MSKLVEHARRELELCGQMKEDPAYAQSIIAAVAAFASFGHSGGSASVAREQLRKLLEFKPLSPITSDPEEWEKIVYPEWEKIVYPEECGKIVQPYWQNKRDSRAMSRDGGKTWWYV